MNKLLIFLSLSLISLFAKPTVTVSILPQSYFVQKIAGDTLNINVMVTPGNSPATYEPKPKQMIQLENSVAYLAIGVPFEASWLPKFQASYPNLPIIHTEKDIQKQSIASHQHTNAVPHDSTQEILDPHIWLDPLHVKTMSRAIATALSNLYPDRKTLYENNLHSFLQELDTLHVEIQTTLANVTRKKFMVYHPSWGYFATRYGLEQEAIEIEGKEPKPSVLVKLIQEAKDENIHLLIVQPQFSQKSAKVIADAINGKVIAIDHLSPNWEQELRKTATLFAQTLRP